MKFQLLASLCVMTMSSAAIGQTVPVPIDGRIEQLKPGEYFWAPQIAPEGPVTIIVSLATQRAYAYRNGVPIGVSTVSTGADGHETPTGVFTILQKNVDHVSNLYANAPMPFMQRLTWDGIAMHAGNLPGYPASHGCIRLPPEFAERLYRITKLGMTVVITDEPTVPILSTAPNILAEDGEQTAGGEGFHWAPERSPTGPVSIVVSGRDRQMVVLRNGIKIGSSAIEIDGPVDRTSAFTLQSIDADGPHWLRLPLPGSDDTGALSASDQGRGRLPSGFRRALNSVLVPGVTLLVTRETLASSGTGRMLTVVTADDR